LSTYTGWACDTCGRVIALPDDGLVAWSSGPNAPYDQIRLVHKDDKKSDADSPCYPREGVWSSIELRELIGDAGLSRLLSWLSNGPLEGRPGGRGVLDVDGFVDLVRRLHTPWYEQARPWLSSRDQTTLGMLDYPNEYSPYVPQELLRIAQERRYS